MDCFPDFFLSQFLIGIRKTTDFGILILCPANLQKLYIRSKTLVESLQLFKHRIITSASRNFTSSFPIELLLFLSLALLWLRIQALCWIKVKKEDTLVSFLTLGKRLSVFPIYYKVLYSFIIYSPYYVEVCSFYFIHYFL
jgi:hypothetical protein